MPSLKAIRKRITSTKATQKITRAMKMVAGARLARAQQRIVAMRPYAQKTAEVLSDVAGAMVLESEGAEELHPLLKKRPEKRVLYLVLTSDRGLCGAFNTNIQKATERAWREKESEGKSVCFATLGKKGREYLGRRKGELLRDFSKIYDSLELASARRVAEWVVPTFSKGEVDAVYLVYNEFKSAITQRVTVQKLLPLDANAEARGASDSQFLFEPDEKTLLERLVPMYLEITLYRSLLESQASEFGARMTAMDAATRNAKEMIAKLTLDYNRARQAAITKELMEIIGGAEALKD